MNLSGLCFYLDRRLGIARPTGFPFNLNSAADPLLRRELDRYRAEGVAHPLMTEAGIRAVAHARPELENWRTHFRRVRYIAIAKKKGVYNGRKSSLTAEQATAVVAKDRANNGRGRAALARDLGVSRQTLYQYLQQAT